MTETNRIEPLFSHPRHVRLRALELAIEIAKVGGAKTPISGEIEKSRVFQTAQAILDFLYADEKVHSYGGKGVDVAPPLSATISYDQPSGPNAGPRMSDI